MDENFICDLTHECPSSLDNSFGLNDGRVTQIPHGLEVCSYPFERYPNMGSSGWKDHYKCFPIFRRIFNVKRKSEMVFSAAISTEQLFLGNPPFPTQFFCRTRNVYEDPRIASGGFQIIDPDSGVYYGFVQSNQSLFGVYGRLPYHPSISFASRLVCNCEKKCNNDCFPQWKKQSDFGDFHRLVRFIDWKNENPDGSIKQIDPELFNKWKTEWLKNHLTESLRDRWTQWKDSKTSTSPGSDELTSWYKWHEKIKKLRINHRFDKGFEDEFPGGGRNEFRPECPIYYRHGGFNKKVCYASFLNLFELSRREELKPIEDFDNVSIVVRTHCDIQTVHYFVNEVEVFKVLTPGHRLGEKYRVIEHGGYAQKLCSDRFVFGFGINSFIDAALPNNYARKRFECDHRQKTALVQLMDDRHYYEIHHGAYGELELCNPDSSFVISRRTIRDKKCLFFGQGAKMRINYVRVMCVTLCHPEMMHFTNQGPSGSQCVQTGSHHYQSESRHGSPGPNHRSGLLYPESSGFGTNASWGSNENDETNDPEEVTDGLDDTVLAEESIIPDQFEEDVTDGCYC